MSDYTKGPWEVLSDEHLKANDPKLKQECLNGFSGEDNILLFGDDCSALGAVYCGYGDKARVNAEADVALISACPDMYEALKKCESYIRIRQKNKSEFSKRTLADKLIEDAQAAIAKAEGKP